MSDLAQTQMLNVQTPANLLVRAVRSLGAGWDNPQWSSGSLLIALNGVVSVATAAQLSTMQAYVIANMAAWDAEMVTIGRALKDIF